jgi:hypothetical protein
MLPQRSSGKTRPLLKRRRSSSGRARRRLKKGLLLASGARKKTKDPWSFKRSLGLIGRMKFKPGTFLIKNNHARLSLNLTRCGAQRLTRPQSCKVGQCTAGRFPVILPAFLSVFFGLVLALSLYEFRLSRHLLYRDLFLRKEFNFRLD